MPFDRAGFRETNHVRGFRGFLQQITGLIQIIAGSGQIRETFELTHMSQGVVAGGLDGGGQFAVVGHEMLSHMQVPLERVQCKGLGWKN